MTESTAPTPARKRILTGDRPTGKLHLGHFVGSHRNRLKFQDEYECFFLVADLHMLTTKPDKESILAIADNARSIVMDHLAIGIDPHKVTFYLQSAVHEIYELQLLLSSLVTVERLQQLPTIKDMASAAGMEQIPYNLLGYPVLQAADILMPRANLVPVGKDNESHVELARQIARRFNHAYGEVFPEPDPYVLGGTLVGTDGQAKMSKSLDNAIFLSDDAKTVTKRVMSMYTDPARIRADIPGTVEGNPVFAYHDVFNPNVAEVDDLKARYREGKVGDVEVKEKLARALNAFLEPMRERRAYYEAQTGYVDELLYTGTLRAREEGRATLIEVKKAMGLTGVWNRISRAAEKRMKKEGVPA
jgi:tryptophanyl-tRNA synthetase